ncbi:MAG: Prolyl endopeptidase precursor, partial [Verrucomicrobiota bacterium]
RAITERPDLFAAAVCNVGIANALRAEFTPNGSTSVSEFGSVAIEAECLALAEMDGVSHVLPGVAYPAVLGVVGWNDSRVEPSQTGKFIAALQARGAPGKPALLKINYDNGHETEDKNVTFRDFASQIAFLLWQTGHPDFQPVAQP